VPTDSQETLANLLKTMIPYEPLKQQIELSYDATELSLTEALVTLSLAEQPEKLSENMVKGPTAKKQIELSCDMLTESLTTLSLAEQPEKSPENLAKEPPENMVKTPPEMIKSSETLNFGKYIGYTLTELLNTDLEYFRWFAGYSGHRRGNSKIPAASSYTWMTFNGKNESLSMHQAARKMWKEKGLCLRCFVPDYDIYKTAWKYWCVECYYSV
jgi:hypothetical protein